MNNSQPLIGSHRWQHLTGKHCPTPIGDLWQSCLISGHLLRSMTSNRQAVTRFFRNRVLLLILVFDLKVEAKSLILACVKSVTFHDEGVVELWDLSSNFIFFEDDVGKNQAFASVQKLQELNNSVVISTLTTELTKEQLSDFQA